MSSSSNNPVASKIPFYQLSASEKRSLARQVATRMAKDKKNAEKKEAYKKQIHAMRAKAFVDTAIAPTNLQQVWDAKDKAIVLNDKTRPVILAKLMTDNQTPVPITPTLFLQMSWIRFPKSGSIVIGADDKTQTTFAPHKVQCRWCAPVNGCDQPLEIPHRRGPKRGIIHRSKCCEVFDTGREYCRTLLSGVRWSEHNGPIVVPGYVVAPKLQNHGTMFGKPVIAAKRNSSVVIHGNVRAAALKPGVTFAAAVANTGAAKVATNTDSPLPETEEKDWVPLTPKEQRILDAVRRDVQNVRDEMAIFSRASLSESADEPQSETLKLESHARPTRRRRGPVRVYVGETDDEEYDDYPADYTENANFDRLDSSEFEEDQWREETPRNEEPFVVESASSRCEDVPSPPPVDPQEYVPLNYPEIGLWHERVSDSILADTTDTILDSTLRIASIVPSTVKEVCHTISVGFARLLSHFGVPIGSDDNRVFTGWLYAFAYDYPAHARFAMLWDRATVGPDREMRQISKPVKILLALEALYGSYSLAERTTCRVASLVTSPKPSVTKLRCQATNQNNAHESSTTSPNWWTQLLNGYERIEDIVLTFLRPLLGHVHCRAADVKRLVKSCADLNTVGSAIERVAGYIRALYDWCMEMYHRHYVGLPAEIKKWIMHADEVKTLYSSPTGFVTIRQNLSKSRHLRKHLFELKDRGMRFKNALESGPKENFLLKLVNERLKKIEEVLRANAGVFAGAEGKEKPLTMFFYGPPDQGKSVLLNPLMEDVFHVLDFEPYIASQDRYTLNKSSEFFDQYHGQRVMDIQDFFQLKDAKVRNMEINTILNCADESVAPLNVAECSGKGTLYFRSDFLVITSNVDIATASHEVSQFMVETKALTRRMDLMIQVSLDRSKVVPNADGTMGFNRDAMRFDVTGGSANVVGTYTWYQLVRVIAESYYALRLYSETMVNEIDNRKLEVIRDSLRPKRLLLEKATRPVPVQEVVQQAPQPSTSSRNPDALVMQSHGLPELHLNEPVVPWVLFATAVFFFVRHQLPAFLRAAKKWANERLQSMLLFLLNSTWEGEVETTLKQKIVQIAQASTTGAILTAMPHYEEVVNGAQRTLDGYIDYAKSWWEEFRRTAAAIFAALSLTALVAKVLQLVKSDTKYHTEAIANSGGQPEHHVVGRERRRRLAYTQEQIEEMADAAPGMFTHGLPGGAMIQQKLLSNLCRIRSPRNGTCALGLYGRVIVAPLHVFKDVRTDDITLVSPTGNFYTFNMADCAKKNVLVSEDAHLVFVNLAEVCKHMPEFATLRGHLAATEGITPGSCGQYITRRLVADKLTDCVIDLTNVKIAPQVEMVDGTQAMGVRRYNGLDFISYQTQSRPGDCGAPVVEYRDPISKVVGIHVAGAGNIGAATPLTQQMFDDVQAAFGATRLQLENHADEFPYEVNPESNGVEIIGTVVKSQRVPWVSRKSKLRPTVFQHTWTPTTMPAMLGKTWVGDTLVSPMQNALMKNEPTIIGFPLKEMFSAADDLSAMYGLSSPGNFLRRKWTLQEALFGDPELAISSYPSKGGVGFPWGLNRKRKDFFTLEPQWISPELIEEVSRLDEAYHLGPEPCIVVDTLKDERRPIHKVTTGKTRIFNVFHLATNVLVKQYFGAFVEYINSHWRTHPVSVGVSTLPEDWHLLGARLMQHDNFVAGDVGAWDRVVPFELLMYWVEQANMFYSDGCENTRWNLGQAIFQPYHLADRGIYRLRRGMPSGSYLTATFNSLCMASVLHMAAKRLQVDALSTMVVFGDDHVISVKDSPFDQLYLQKFFASYNLEYTAADKSEVDAPYTTRKDLRFLKRAFVKKGQLYHGPIDVHDLIEQMMWYKLTSTVRAQTRCELYQRMFSQLQMELALHSKAVYTDVSAAFHKILAENGFPVVSMTYQQRYDSLFCRNTSLGKNPMSKMFENQNVVLTAHGDVCEDEATAGETTVGDTQPSTLRVGLDDFKELSQPVSVNTGFYGAPNINTAFPLPDDFFDMIVRPRLIGEYQLPTSDPTVCPFLRLDVFGVLLQDNEARSKLAMASFVRYEIELDIRIVATKFHYGQLMLAWRPNYYGGLSHYKFTNDASGIGVNGPTSKMINAWSPYDTVFCASQQESTCMSITGNTVVQMTIPWVLPYEKVPAGQMTYPRYHPGLLDIYMLTPTGPSDLDRPYLAVFANLKNIHGWGFCEQNFCPILKTTTPSLPTIAVPLKMESPTWNMTARAVLPVPVTRMVTQGALVPDPLAETGAAPAPAKKVEDKVNAEPSKLRQFIQVAYDVGKVAVQLFTPFGTILNWLGLSRPQKQVQTRAVTLTIPNIVSSVGIENAQTWAYNSALRLDIDSGDSRQLLLSRLGEVSTYLGWLMTGSTKIDIVFPIDPRCTANLTPKDDLALGGFAVTPAGWVLLGRFGYFRCGAKVSIRFSASAFIACRFAVSVGYDSNLQIAKTAIKYFPTKIVDVQGDSCIDVEIPYLRDTPWIDVDDSAPFAYLRLQQLTQVVSPQASETRPILITMFASFPDFQVSEPRVAQTGDAAQFRATLHASGNTLALVTQGDGCEPFPRQGSVGVPRPWAMNDIPASLLHLVKRYRTVPVKKRVYLCPTNPVFPSYSKDITNNRHYSWTVHVTNYHAVAELFRYHRASMALFGKVEEMVAVGGSWSNGWYQTDTVKKNWAYGATSYPPATVHSANTWLTLPYYASVQYLPTPTPCVIDADEKANFFVASPYTRSDLQPPIKTQTYYTAAASLFIGASDDAMFKTFIGCPIQTWAPIESF